MNYTSLNDGDQVSPSLAIAQKIALSTPHALFCSFSVRGDGSNTKKVPRKFNGEYWVDGVDADTPVANLITSKFLTEYKDPPEPNGYLGLVLHNQIKDPFDSPEYTLVCIDADTKRKPENEPYHIVIGALSKWARENNHLREIGYSGKGGFHVFIWAKVDQRIQKKYQLSTGQDIEVFGGIVGKKASVMLSGKKLAGDLQSEPVDLFELFEQLGVKQKVMDKPVDKPEPLFPKLPLAPNTNPKDWTSDYDKAQQALTFLDPDMEHDEWVAIGMALKDGLQDQGLTLWLQWSQQGSKFKSQREVEQKFHSFKGNGIHINSLFAKATELGWNNPNKGKSKKSSPLDDFKIVKNDMGEFIDPETGEVIDESNLGWSEVKPSSQLKPVNYIIDGFLANTFMVVAGQPGVGKTVAMLSLAMAVAGFNIPNSDAINKKPRKILYVTEDSEQVERSLIGYSKMYQIPFDEIQNKFVLIEARRSQLPKVLELIYNVKRHTIDNVTPWLVIDTSNATLDIENENDNSEVGKFMSGIKAHIHDELKTPVAIVTHTNKMVSKKDDEAAARGASAFTGDPRLTAVIFMDDDKNRYIRLGKKRYEPKFDEMIFETEFYHEMVIDENGDLQDVKCIITVPKISSAQDRVTAQINEKENAKQQKIKNIKDSASVHIINMFNQNPNGLLMRKGRCAPTAPKWVPKGVSEMTLESIFKHCEATNTELKNEVKEYVWNHVVVAANDGWNWLKMVNGVIVNANV